MAPEYRVPVVLRVHREYVDGELVRVMLEPFDLDDVVELDTDPPPEFVTVMAKRPLGPGSWGDS